MMFSGGHCPLYYFSLCVQEKINYNLVNLHPVLSQKLFIHQADGCKNGLLLTPSDYFLLLPVA